LKLQRGAVVSFNVSDAGGDGDPKQRDPKSVRADVGDRVCGRMWGTDSSTIRPRV
jgi:hypothetical protein